MKKIFKKAMTVFGGFALIGATISGAAAANYPTPFTGNSAVVIGASAAPSDLEAATTIVDGLNQLSTSTTKTASASLTGGESVTEDEVVLGGSITAGTSDIDATIVSGSGKSKISSLMKSKLSWDDGAGSDDYDVEEKILVSNMNVTTRLDDKNLEEDVALTNDQGLEYRLVFKELFNTSLVGSADADKLYLEILGKEYEITSMTTDSMTVVTSEQFSLGVGQSATVGGKTFTVNSIFGSSVEVNGQIITTSKKIDGMKVEVDSIGYHSNAPEQSRVVLKIGEDISKTYTSGEEYIGQDSKDPLWTWNINLVTGAESYIGVKYSAKVDKQKAAVAGDQIKYIGGAYVFPDNFGQVSLDGLTEVTYEDMTIYFQDGTDLYNKTDSSDVMFSGKDVIVIEGKDTDTITTGGEETDKMFIYYDTTTADIQTYRRDWNGDYTPSGRMRVANVSALDLTNAGTGGNAIVGTFTVGETELDLRMNVTGNVTAGTARAYLQIENDGDVVLKSKIGGTALGNAAGTFEQLGSDAEGTATAEDAIFSGEEVSTQQYSYMDAFGIKIAEDGDVKSQVEDDRIILSIPSEQVYAKVSVTVGGEAVESGDETSETGVKLYRDNEAASFADKNVIVVGGSAINAIAAELLGDSYEEEAFTTKTTVGAGQFLIKSFARSGKTALLVAGYNAADTENAVSYLVNKGVDTTQGNAFVGTTATEPVVKLA
jgi:hypothetical protein